MLLLLQKPLVYLALGIAISIGICSPAPADIIELDGGHRIQGVIVRQNARSVEVQTSGGRLSLSRAKIKKIENESEAANILQDAEANLRRGQLLEAAQEVEEALQKGLGSRNVRLWCIQKGTLFEHALKPEDAGSLLRWAGLFRQLANLDHASSNTIAATGFSSLAASQTLTTMYPSLPTSALSETWATSVTLSPAPIIAGSPLPEDERDFLLVIGRVLSQKNQQKLACEMIAKLDAVSLSLANKSLAFVQPLIINYVKMRLDAFDFAAAADMVAKMQQAGMVGGEACQVLLLIRWSSHARQKGLYTDAMDILSQRLEPISPELARERMAATLAEARESLAQNPDYEKIVALHVKHANRLAPDIRNQTLAMLYHDWGKHLLDTKQPALARAVLQQYYLLSPQASQNLLDLCTYKETFLGLNPKDYASHFELGQWAAEHGLVDEALESFGQAAAHADLKQAAEEQMEQLKERVAVAYLDRCMKLFEQGDPRAALDEISKLPFMPTTRKIEPEIKKLRELCYSELKRRSELRGVQAESLFQDAQRRFFLNETEPAIKDLHQILRNFADTLAAERAAEFLRYAETRKKLEKIDGSGPKVSEGKLQLQNDTALEQELKSLVEQLQISDTDSSPSSALAPAPGI